MGAGPAGLTAAYELLKRDVPVTVVEKDAKQVGGLARTVEYKGYRFDIGGHRVFSKKEQGSAPLTGVPAPGMWAPGPLLPLPLPRPFFRSPSHTVTRPLD